MAEEKLIGKVTHFFNNISVAVLEISEALAVGDKIRIKGSGDFEETIDSMQIDRKDVAAADSGEVAIKVSQKAKEGDEIFKIV